MFYVIYDYSTCLKAKLFMRKVIQIVLVGLYLTVFNYDVFALTPSTLTAIEQAGGGSTITTGCIGQTIRILGTNFQSTAMTITINGGATISSYTYFSSTIIEVIIPIGTPSSGAGIIVTNNSAVASNQINFIVLQGITFTPPITSQTLCEGSPFTIYVSASNGGTLSYQWQKGGVNIGTNTSLLSIPSVLPSDAGSYTLTITSLTCLSTVTTSPSILIVDQKPSSPDAYLPANPNQIENCQNTLFTMAAKAAIVGETGTWSIASGIGTITNTSSPTSTITGVSQEQLVTLNWTISTGGVCADSVSSVTLYNYSPVSPPAALGGPAVQNICLSSPATSLTAATPSGIYTSFSWVKVSGPSASVPVTPNNNYTPFTASAVGTYVFNFVIYNGACSSTSSNLDVNVYNPPTVAIGSSSSQCFGTPLVFNGSATNATTISWSYSGGAGSLNSTSILNPIYTSVGSDSLGVNISTTLTVSNPGCGPISTDGLFTINQKPHATIVSGPPITICAGGAASIPITFDGVKPFTGLGIFNGVSTTNLGTIPNLSYSALVSPTANANYTLVLSTIFKDSNNCVGAISGNRAVIVSPAPTAAISVSPSTICAGNNALVTVKPSGGGGPSWIIYYNTGGANSSATISGSSTTIPVAPSSTTDYIIDSIETTTCGKVKLNGVNALLTVNSPPSAGSTLTIAVSNDTLCKGETTTITLTNIQPNTVYKVVKNFINKDLDSIIVLSAAPTSLSVTVPYSIFTPGREDTIHFLARRTGCALVPSLNKVYIWTSNLATPSVSISPIPASCSRKTLQIATPQPGVAYQWYEGNGQLVGETSITDTAFYAGAYYVKATDTLFCLASSNLFSVNYSALKPSITLTDVSTVETKLMATASSQKYRWYAQTTTGIKLIEGDTSQNISVYFDGDYYLRIINNTCIYTSDPITVSSKLGGNLLRQGFIETDSSIIIPKVDFTQNVNLYPNPVFNSDIMVDYVAGDVTKVSFILYNSQGLIMTQKVIDGNGLIRTTINTKNLQSGVYNLYIDDGVKQVRKNIIVY
jgi:mucin-2